MNGQELLALGLVVFFVAHVAAGIHEFRSTMVARIGTPAYRAVHALVAAAAMVLIVIGFATGEYGEVYTPASWGRTVAIWLMPIAFILLVGAYLAPGLQRIVRHPLLAGIGLFSALHLLANGDTASVQVFGAFLAYSLLAMGLADRKLRLGDPDAWATKRSGTALLPFAALATGRATWADCRPGLLKAVVAGLVLYAVLGSAHGALIGVPVL